MMWNELDDLVTKRTDIVVISLTLHGEYGMNSFRHEAHTTCHPADQWAAV